MYMSQNDSKHIFNRFKDKTFNPNTLGGEACKTALVAIMDGMGVNYDEKQTKSQTKQQTKTKQK